MSSLKYRALAVLTACSGVATAEWTVHLDTPAGVWTCEHVAEPFIYYSDTCEFLAFMNPPAKSRRVMWEDHLIQSAVTRGASGCIVPYVHFVWIDNHIYPLASTAIVQHTRDYLSIFSLTLQGCARSNGLPATQTGVQRLLLANIDLATSGNAEWFYDIPTQRAYFRVRTVTGDVTCAGNQPAPQITTDNIFKNGFE